MSDWWTNTFGGNYKLKENEVKLSNETEEYAFEIELCIHEETELLFRDLLVTKLNPMFGS